MKANSFEQVGGEAPLEMCLHDTTRCKHNDPSNKFTLKDEFDVYVYKEIGVDIIYMNKKKLRNQISEGIVDEHNRQCVDSIWGNRTLAYSTPYIPKGYIHCYCTFIFSIQSKI